MIIDYTLVAAAVRLPPRVIGDGRSKIASLIGKTVAPPASPTGGESRIPLDAETDRCLAEQGLDLETILDEGGRLRFARPLTSMLAGRSMT